MLKEQSFHKKMWWQTNLKFLPGNFVKTSLHLRCRGMAQGVKINVSSGFQQKVLYISNRLLI